MAFIPSSPRIESLENQVPVGRRFVEIQGETSFPSAPAIPRDDTIPQITEGAQIFSLTYTPKKIGNLIIIKSVAHILYNTTVNPIYALWLFGNADAVSGTINGSVPVSNRGASHIIHHELTVASLTPMAVETRTGSDLGVSTIILNKLIPAANFGPIINSWITVEEFATPPT